MNTATKQITQDDIAALAELLMPHLTEPTANGVLDAVARAKQQNERDLYRRLGQVHILVDALSGTYDEFRAEGA